MKVRIKIVVVRGVLSFPTLFSAFISGEVTEFHVALSTNDFLGTTARSEKQQPQPHRGTRT
jgi:hypothetical protein